MLLWHAVIMILSLLILVYYFYAVYELLARKRFESKVRKAILEIKIEKKLPEMPSSLRIKHEESVSPQQKRVRIVEPETSD